MVIILIMYMQIINVDGYTRVIRSNFHGRSISFNNEICHQVHYCGQENNEAKFCDIKLRENPFSDNVRILVVWVSKNCIFHILNTKMKKKNI